MINPLDANLDAIALVQAMRTYRNDENKLPLELWVRQPRRYTYLYTVCMILAGVIADNTSVTDLEDFALTLLGVQD